VAIHLTFEMFRLDSYADGVTGLRNKSTIFKVLKVVLVLYGGQYAAARLKSSLMLPSPPTRTNIPNPRRRVSHHQQRFQPLKNLARSKIEDRTIEIVAHDAKSAYAD
jgi:hypothetical protein